MRVRVGASQRECGCGVDVVVDVVQTWAGHRARVHAVNSAANDSVEYTESTGTGIQTIVLSVP